MADGMFVTFDYGLEESLPPGMKKGQYIDKATEFLTDKINQNFLEIEED